MATLGSIDILGVIHHKPHFRWKCQLFVLYPHIPKFHIRLAMVRVEDIEDDNDKKDCCNNALVLLLLYFVLKMQSQGGWRKWRLLFRGVSSSGLFATKLANAIS